jgi:hypothetical protein
MTYLTIKKNTQSKGHGIRTALILSDNDKCGKPLIGKQRR